MMVAIKAANETNDGNVYGFLPSDNRDYLQKYNDELLYSWIQNFKNRVPDFTLDLYEVLDETEKRTNEAVINIKNMLSPSEKYVSLVTITLNSGVVIKQQLYDEDFEGMGCQWHAGVETGDLTGDGVEEIILALKVHGSTYGASYIYVYQIADGGLNALLELNDDGVDKIINLLKRPADETDRIRNCLITCSWAEIEGSKLIVYGNVNYMGYDTVAFIFDNNGNWQLAE